MSDFDDSPFDDPRPFRGGGHGSRGPRGRHGARAEWLHESLNARAMRGRGFDPREFGIGGRRARRGQLRQSILVLLAEQPRNGYQLMGAIAEKTSGAWTPSPGALYPALAQLVDEGLIAEQSANGAKVYVLTETGQAEVAKVSDEPWAEAAIRGQAGLEQRQALWDEFRRLAATVRLAGDTAAPDQLDELAKGLADQRKQILRTLGDQG